MIVLIQLDNRRQLFETKGGDCQRYGKMASYAVVMVGKDRCDKDFYSTEIVVPISDGSSTNEVKKNCGSE